MTTTAHHTTTTPTHACPFPRRGCTSRHCDVRQSAQRLMRVLADAIPSVGPFTYQVATKGPTPEEFRAMLRAAVSRPLEPPTYLIHPAAWDAYVAGECTCDWVVPWVCVVHHPEIAASFARP